MAFKAILILSVISRGESFGLGFPLEGVDMPWPSELLQSALFPRGDMTRLRLQVDSALRGESNFTIVVVGGSPAAGAGCGGRSVTEKESPTSEEFRVWAPVTKQGHEKKYQIEHTLDERRCAFSGRVVKYLRPLFHSRNFRVINAAVHGRGIMFNLLKATELYERKGKISEKLIGTIDRSIGEDVSLIVVEHSGNDRSLGKSTAPILEAYVRYALNRPSRPAVVLLDLPTGGEGCGGHHGGLPCVKPESDLKYSKRGMYSIQHRIDQSVAGYYQLPVISTTALLFGGSAAGMALAKHAVLATSAPLHAIAKNPGIHPDPSYHEITSALLATLIYSSVDPTTMHNATWEPSAVKPLPAEFQSSSYRHPVQLKEEQWKLPPVLWIQECANIDYNASMSEDSDANALEGSIAAAKGEINSALCRMAHGIIPRVGFDFSANPEGGEDATVLAGKAWWWGSDLALRVSPGWLTCNANSHQFDEQARTLSVSVACSAGGDLFVGYLGSYSPFMGIVEVRANSKEESPKWVSNRGKTLGFIDSWRLSGHESTFQFQQFSNLSTNTASISFKVVPRSNRTLGIVSGSAEDMRKLRSSRKQRRRLVPTSVGEKEIRECSHNSGEGKFKLLFLACY